MANIQLLPNTDLFTVTADAYAQGCNTLGLMGAGIARQFKDRYSDMAEAYKKFCEIHGFSKDLRGTMYVWDRSAPIILNLFTQYQPGRHPVDEYDECLGYVRTCFERMFAYATTKELDSIAMPQIAAGIYRLDWDDVFEQLVQAYDESDWNGVVMVALK